MRDIDVLVESVLDQDAKRHFVEAVQAYRAGAHRASIISIWIAISVDLISKVRHLSDVGDAAARVAVAALDKSIDDRDVKRMQAFERELLELCLSELQLITARERVELQRIYEDRNLCAHPSFSENGEEFRPSAEVVRSHLATSCDVVLAQHAIAGKKMIANFRAEAESDSWPTSDVRPYLREKYFDRSRPQVQRNLTELIVKASITPDTGKDQLAYRCVRCAHAIHEFDPVLLAEAVDSVVDKRENSGSLNDKALVRLVGAFGSLEATWNRVPGAVRTRIHALMAKAENEFFIEHRLFATGYPCDADVRLKYVAIIDSLSMEQVDLLLLRPFPSEQFVEPALRFLRESASFRTSEENMRRVVKISKHLNLANLESISETILSNDQIRLASDMPSLLLSIYADTNALAGSAVVWKNLAVELGEKYGRSHSSDPDGYYSYPELQQAVNS